MKEKLSKSEEKAPLCACGCGQPVTKSKLSPYDWNKYLNGHYLRDLEYRRKISESLTGRKLSAEHRKNLSKVLTGRKQSVEHRRNCRGENHPRWIDGRTYKIRPPELTLELRQAIRRRDNFTCQFCGYKNKGKWRKLEVHHVDCDPRRKNNHPDNLITLCKKCHGETKTIGDKAAWQRVYTNLIKRIKRQNPEGHHNAVRIWKKNIESFCKK